MKENCKRTRIKVEPGDLMELLQSCDETLTDEELLPMAEQRKGFLRETLFLVKIREDC